MPRPRQVSDERILEVARECCLELGAPAPTTTIAARLGVSQAVLFQRFGTKEKLLLAALAPPARAPFVDLAERGPDARPMREQLLELGGAIQRYFDEMAPRWALLRSCGVPIENATGDEPPPVRAHRALAGFLARASERGLIRTADADHLAFIILGSLQIRPWFQHVLKRERPLADRPAYLHTFLDLIWPSLEPAAAGAAEKKR